MDPAKVSTTSVWGGLDRVQSAISAGEPGDCTQEATS
jgi:hypothetical protein